MFGGFRNYNYLCGTKIKYLIFQQKREQVSERQIIMLELFKTKKVETPVVVKEKTTITFITKKYEKLVFEDYDLSIDIMITDVTFKGGVCKGKICYKKVPKFGTVWTDFHFEFTNGYLNDFSYECGSLVPYSGYIYEVIEILKERKQLR